MKKVLLINGSPKKDGNTATSFKVIEEQLHKAGIETEVVHVGNKNIRGCVDCGACFSKHKGQCTFQDGVNEIVDKFSEVDGLVLGSPVYYAGMNGTMKSFLDRAFRLNGARGNVLRHKAGASIASVRRSGGIPTVDTMNYYLQYSEMFLVSSNYWLVAHGNQPGETMQDLEGVNIMQNLGQNMAALITNTQNMESPEKIKKVWMNFIR